MELGAAGLQEQPFDTDSRPLTVVSYQAKQKALEFLQSTYSNNHGLGVFIGPELSGKSTILQHFSDTIGNDTASAVVDGAGLEISEMLGLALSQYGYELEFDSLNELVGMLKVFAQQQAVSQRPPLLIVENAHAMLPEALDVLCSLASLKVNHNSAMRLVLSSCRCIRPIINAPAMAPISSRLTGTFELEPLTHDETAGYIHAKLRAGGCFDPENVFPQPVCSALYSASSGWPGKIDRLVVLAMARAPHPPVEIEHIDGVPRPQAQPDPISLDEKRDEQLVDQDAEPAKLMLTRDGKPLKEIVLSDARMMIGRSEHNDLSINSKFISRHHALFVKQGPAIFLMDLNSTNGTYVNSRRISNQVLINDDLISLGNHGLRFIDPNASNREEMENIGFAGTSVIRTLRDVRRMLAQENIQASPADGYGELKTANED